MNPNRHTTTLPSGMNVRILTPISRSGNIYGIEAEEVSRHTGIPITDHSRLSDWASNNDALFYAEKQSRFSLDRAAQEAAALGVPRVVLFRIPEKKESECNELQSNNAVEASEKPKKKIVRRRQKPTVDELPPTRREGHDMDIKKSEPARRQSKKSV